MKAVAIDQVIKYISNKQINRGSIHSTPNQFDETSKTLVRSLIPFGGDGNFLEALELISAVIKVSAHTTYASSACAIGLRLLSMP